MQISNEGVKFIKDWEGCRLKMYPCAAGKLTIGYGHRVPADQVSVYKNGIDLITAERLFKRDLAVIETLLNHLLVLFKFILTQHQYDALCSFIFNCGISAFENSTLLRDLENGNIKDVPVQFIRWVKDDHGKTIEGLVNRRKAEVKLWSNRASVENILKIANARVKGT